MANNKDHCFFCQNICCDILGEMNFPIPMDSVSIFDNLVPLYVFTCGKNLGKSALNFASGDAMGASELSLGNMAPS